MLSMGAAFCIRVTAVVSNIVRYGDRSEPKYGLEPRFEALTQFVKSPNSSRGVMIKAITPPPQQDYITDNLRMILYLWMIL